MKRIPQLRMLCTIVPTCLALLACGGGGGGDGSGGDPGGGYVAASSGSFSPTTAKDKATSAQNVPLHWVYVVNDGQPVQANVQGVAVGIGVTTMEVKLDPATLQRTAAFQGPVSGTFEGTAFSGDFAAAVTEDLMFSGGKTVFKTVSSVIDLTLAGGGDSATAKATVTLANFTPPYEWLLDSATLDQLPVGQVLTVTSSGSANINVTVTDEPPIVVTNQPTTISDRWTVLEKLPTMVVRGKSYSNVVKLSLQTRVPDLNGNLTTVTMYYWVAQGIGMIQGLGVLRVLNIDNVVYELSETNLTQ